MVTIVPSALWVSDEPAMRFTWQVDGSLEPSEVYVLCLRGQGYADISGWFEVQRGEEENPLYYEELELANGTKWARFQVGREM